MQNTIKEFFPIWNELSIIDQKKITEAVICKTIEKNSTIHNGDLDCQGLILVKKGQLRAYIFSEKGRKSLSIGCFKVNSVYSPLPVCWRIFNLISQFPLKKTRNCLLFLRKSSRKSWKSRLPLPTIQIKLWQAVFRKSCGLWNKSSGKTSTKDWQTS